MKKLVIAIALASGIGAINTASAQVPVVGGWVDLEKVVASFRQYSMQQKQGQQHAEKKQQMGSTIPTEK